MNAKRKLHQAHMQEWAARFSEQKASGLTARQWCEKNHISIHKYNYWKHLLKEEFVDQMLPDILPLPIPSDPSVSSVLPVPSPDRIPAGPPVRTDRTNRAIRVTHLEQNIRLCIDGVSLEFASPVPEDFLRALIRAVHYA